MQEAKDRLIEDLRRPVFDDGHVLDAQRYSMAGLRSILTDGEKMDSDDLHYAKMATISAGRDTFRNKNVVEALKKLTGYISYQTDRIRKLEDIITNLESAALRSAKYKLGDRVVFVDDWYDHKQYEVVVVSNPISEVGNITYSVVSENGNTRNVAEKHILKKIGTVCKPKKRKKRK